MSTRFGIITPPVSGHINPLAALGRELQRRGHSVTVFHMADLRQRVQSEGLLFQEIGGQDHPPGTLAQTLEGIGGLTGWAALRFTVHAAARTTRMFLRDAPAAIRTAGIEALLVDQTEPAGASIAELSRLPFATICNALVLNEDPSSRRPLHPGVTLPTRSPGCATGWVIA
ncbi:MAG: glycosyltransferase [Bryobacteraceae bacterium]